MIEYETQYMGVGDVARLCGVAQSTVSHWLRRFPREVPKAKAGTGVSHRPILGWEPTPEVKTAWLVFAGMQGARREAEAPDGAEGQSAQASA